MSDYLRIENFNIEQLDSDGKKALDEFEQRFIELRKKQATLPPDFYKMATDFHTASCRAQTEVQKITMQHFATEWRKDQQLGCELDCIHKWQIRKALKKAFIQEQRRLKKPLPWKYDFWGNLMRALQSLIVMFIPPQIVRLFTRKPPKTPLETPPAPNPNQTPAPPQKSTKMPLVPATAAMPADAEQHLVNSDIVPANAVDAATAVVTPNTTPTPTTATPMSTGLVSRRSIDLKGVKQ